MSMFQSDFSPSRYLTRDLPELGLVLLDVLALGVVEGDQLLPIAGLVVDEVANHLARAGLLRGRALAALVL